jgi:maltooligosyltrehalose trehalohydrolase
LPSGIAPARLVICIQNHDQVGNRAAGERLSALVPFEALKLAAGITLLSPFTPLLFMGEEYGELAPFQYFTSHGDRELVKAVRRGRGEEFMSFGWQDGLPDPQDEATFARSHLNHSLKSKEPGRTLFALYKQLIRLRGELGIATASSHSVRQLGEHQVAVFYQTRCRTVAVAFNFADSGAGLDPEGLEGNWAALLYSASASWKGPERGNPTAIERFSLAPYSFFLLEQKHSPSEVQ